MTLDERNALARFVDTVRRHYGARLGNVFVFGSRARADHREDSDVDLAVILKDEHIDFWAEKFLLIDLADDAFLDSDLMIQAWPVGEAAWNEPGRHYNPQFVRAARRDARPVGEAA